MTSQNQALQIDHSLKLVRALLISTILRMRLKVLWPHHTRIKVKRSREIHYSLGQSIVFSYFKPLLTSISMAHSRWILTSESSLLDIFGAFHSAQNTGIFDQKSNETNQCGSVRAKYLKVVYTDRSTLTGLHWPVWSFLSVELPKCACPFDKIVVPTTAHLYDPVCKYNNKKRNGLGRVRATRMYRPTGHMKFLRFQTAILLEWKAPFPSRTWTEFGITRVWRNAVAR